MAAHLKRQAGVTDASYKKGTIEVRSDAARAFEIAQVLRIVRDEMGVSPVKRIEATIRGRVVVTSSGGKALHVAGSEERLPLQDRVGAARAEEVFTGLIEVNSDGSLTFKTAPAR